MDRYRERYIEIEIDRYRERYRAIRRGRDGQ